jgi:hypothetical protein
MKNIIAIIERQFIFMRVLMWFNGQIRLSEAIQGWWGERKKISPQLAINNRAAKSS